MNDSEPESAWWSLYVSVGIFQAAVEEEYVGGGVMRRINKVNHQARLQSKGPALEGHCCTGNQKNW